jgi:hypothetical protein
MANFLRAKFPFLIAVALCAALFFGCATLTSPKIEPSDFQMLAGPKWIGTLTYLDYGDGQKTSIASTLSVTQLAEDKLKWDFDYQYPDEPKANNISTYIFSTDGSMIGDEKIVQKNTLADGTIKIISEQKSQDNSKPALLRFTRLISAKNFSIKKEVMVEGEKTFFERNEYRWKR